MDVMEAREVIIQHRHLVETFKQALKDDVSLSETRDILRDHNQDANAWMALSEALDQSESDDVAIVICDLAQHIADVPVGALENVNPNASVFEFRQEGIVGAISIDVLDGVCSVVIRVGSVLKSVSFTKNGDENGVIRWY